MMPENAKKVMFLICEIGNVTGKVFEDGKVSVSDAAHLLALTDELSALRSIDWPAVPGEIMTSFDSPEDYQATLAELVKKFDIPQDHIELKIEKSLGAIGHLVAGVTTLIAVWKK